MPEYWLDANVLIDAKNGHFSFEVAPGFWDCLVELAVSGCLRSPLLVLAELTDGNDELAKWAKNNAGVLFCDPSEEVQHKYNEIADYVRGYYDEAFAKTFLEKADAWHIAHAACEGGRVVTSETPSRTQPPPRNSKAKIPDVAKAFDVECMSMNGMLIAADVQITFSIGR
ncbi:MAG: DUF4411 family protein [Dehalococcoidia bacterium]